jgi:hypothetical protein
VAAATTAASKIPTTRAITEHLRSSAIARGRKNEEDAHGMVRRSLSIVCVFKHGEIA